MNLKNFRSSWNHLVLLLGLLLLAGLALNACRGQSRAEIILSPTVSPVSEEKTDTPLAPGATATRILNLGTPVAPTITPTSTETVFSPASTAEESRLITATLTANPSQTPLVSAGLGSSSGAYPGISGAETGFLPEAYPGLSITEAPYPGVEIGEPASYPYPGETGGIFGALGQANPTLQPTPTVSQPVQALVTSSPTPTSLLADRQITATLPSITASSSVFKPLVVLPNGSNPILEIWHSLQGDSLTAVVEVVQAFQQTNPQVGVVLTYIPIDALRNMYETAIYQGRGPDILIAPSDWNARLSSQALIADLTAYFPASFWQTIAPPALETGRHQGKQTCLPFAMQGVVLYRNRQIISQSAARFDPLVRSAQSATRGGVIGAYFDLGALYSMAFYDRMGGRWMDELGRPLFQQENYAKTLDWFRLLAEFDRAGAVEVNTARDLSLFKQGKVGYILDGTWNLQALAQAIGIENLAIDMMPEYQGTRLSGYVQSQCLYLRAGMATRQDTHLPAALQWMGAMLTQPAQRLLADAGNIPTRIDLQAEDALIRQAAAALQQGVAFPPALQDAVREIYWTALENAIRKGLGIGTQSVSFEEVISGAYQEIIQNLSVSK